MAVTGEQILPQRGMVPKYANLYIGGIPLTFSHYFPHVAMGFIGCMDSLKVKEFVIIKNKLFSIPGDLTKSFNYFKNFLNKKFVSFIQNSSELFRLHCR